MQSAPRFGRITEPIMSLTLGTVSARAQPSRRWVSAGWARFIGPAKTAVTSDVARKVLTERFTADRARMARFPREAEVLDLLNHSNLGYIYGFVESAGTEVLVWKSISPERQGLLPHGWHLCEHAHRS